MKINLTEEEVKTIRNCVLYVLDHKTNCVDRAKLWDISRHLFQGDEMKENENDKQGSTGDNRTEAWHIIY